MGRWTILTAVTLLAAAPPDLRITLVGNAGVVVTDGQTTLLVDLPYEPGAFGYMDYDPGALVPEGSTVSVVTHHHRDHFDRELFRGGDDWRLIAPPSARAGVDASRIIEGDSVTVGAFSIVSLRTPHTDDHRSYRIRWGDRVLVVPGDTESPDFLRDQPAIDLLFLTPWLSCYAERAEVTVSAARSVAYHLRPSGDDRVCGDVEVLTQGSNLSLEGPASEE